MAPRIANTAHDHLLCELLYQVPQLTLLRTADYSKGKWMVRVNFNGWPGKALHLMFEQTIYHPNIDDEYVLQLVSMCACTQR